MLKPKSEGNTYGVLSTLETLPKTLTIHRSKLKVEFHLVASIVNEVGMEDGIRSRASKHTIPTSQSTMRRRRLHVIEIPRQHESSVVLSPFAHVHHILPIIQYTR